MSRLGNILNAIIAPFGKTLWTGTWSSGSITVSGISKYSVILAFLGTGSGVPSIGWVSDGQLYAFAVSGSSNAHVTRALSATVSNDTLTMTHIGALTHLSNSNHSAINTSFPCVKIIGLVPNWGG